MNTRKTVLILLIAVLAVGFYAFDLGQYFSLEYLKAQQQAIDTHYRAHPWQTALIYFAVYARKRLVLAPEEEFAMRGATAEKEED